MGQDLGRGGGELPGGGGGTEARLSLQLSDRVRLQAHLARGALIPSVTLQYSSEGIAGGLGGSSSRGEGGSSRGEAGRGPAAGAAEGGAGGGDGGVPRKSGDGGAAGSSSSSASGGGAGAGASGGIESHATPPATGSSNSSASNSSNSSKSSGGGGGRPKEVNRVQLPTQIAPLESRRLEARPRGGAAGERPEAH